MNMLSLCVYYDLYGNITVELFFCFLLDSAALIMLNFLLGQNQTSHKGGQPYIEISLYNIEPWSCGYGRILMTEGCVFESQH